MKMVNILKTRGGRVHREIGRQLDRLPEQANAKIQDLLQRVDRILTQKTKDKNKLHALQAPSSNASAEARRARLTSSA